ncbi:probable receptor-like protein kinase At5g59700 [Rutidosis leptorrhynchoides]|uniref:probable receptor-like protein kinase At5g59700 n=1 Tax=Rutidosis leptorrhynchoides TaxID=125765 RepID=UPI003A99A3E0
MKTLEEATQNFSENTLIKHCNDVYIGELPDSHQIIAIRKCREWKEIDICDIFQHDNIIRCIGYTFTNSDKFIVSEYAVNGALDEYLKDESKRCRLTWEQRLKICIGAARGLKYLHLGIGDNMKLIHGKFNSGKILLDENLEPKIHNFRNSVFVHKNAPPGKYARLELHNLGYMDPLLTETMILKLETDVYAFGVVLFEILSGLPPYHPQTDPQYCTRDGEPHHLMSMVRQYHDSLIDPYIRDQIDVRCLDTFKEIAYKCVSYNAKDRPSISKVVKRLKEALYIQNHGGFISTITQKNNKVLDDFKIPLDEINLAIGVKDKGTFTGEGGYGVVYRGTLSERWQNRKVAIKFLKPKDGVQQMELNFRSELEMIFNFSHQNIISFIGYCDEGAGRIIVYDLAANGSLDDYLWKEDNRRSLTWAQRLNICLGAARGLDYLHSGLGEEKKVIHRDVKSGNILLDENLEAKICDFGLSKSDSTVGQLYTHEYTPAVGTDFYIDPVYNEGGVLRKESDVYSFGVVMFELLSGMLAYDIRSFEDGKPAQPLLNQVRRYYEQRPELLIDPFIEKEINTPSFNAFKNIAIQCISFNSKERPTMELIADVLDEALDLQMELNFRTDLEMIFNFNHQNMISFMGYCDDRNEKIIVYDLAANGSLDNYLEKEDNRRSLTWAKRLKICLGAA